MEKIFYSFIFFLIIFLIIGGGSALTNKKAETSKDAQKYKDNIGAILVLIIFVYLVGGVLYMFFDGNFVVAFLLAFPLIYVIVIASSKRKV